MRAFIPSIQCCWTSSRNSSRHAIAQFLTFTLAEPSYLPGTKCLSFLTQPMARNDLYEELRAINRGSG